MCFYLRPLCWNPIFPLQQIPSWTSQPHQEMCGSEFLQSWNCICWNYCRRGTLKYSIYNTGPDYRKFLINWKPIFRKRPLTLIWSKFLINMNQDAKKKNNITLLSLLKSNFQTSSMITPQKVSQCIKGWLQGTIKTLKIQKSLLTKVWQNHCNKRNFIYNTWKIFHKLKNNHKLLLE